VAQEYEWRDVTSVGFQGSAIGADSEYPALIAGSGEYVSYDPMVDKPKLFLDFMNLETSREGISEFAHEHGLLGADVPAYVGNEERFWPIDSGGNKICHTGDYIMVTVDPFVSWLVAVYKMKYAFDTYQAMVKKPYSFEAKRGYEDAQGIALSSDRTIYLGGSGPNLTVNAEELLLADPVEYWPRMDASGGMLYSDDYIEELVEDGRNKRAAIVLVQHRINQALSQGVAVHRNTKGLVDVQVDVAKNGSLNWHYVPNCLLGALWLQFARSFMRVEIVTCWWCGKEMTVGVGGKYTRRRQFCDNDNKCHDAYYNANKPTTVVGRKDEAARNREKRSAIQNAGGDS